MGTAFIYDRLLAGEFDRTTSRELILTGQGVLARGTALGQISLAAGTAVKTSGNTGTATCGAITLLSGAKLGSYIVTAISVASHVATFAVIDPKGVRLSDAVQGVAYADQVGFTIAVVGAGTDTIVGDSFTLPVVAGSGKLQLLNSANVDGSQNIYAILAESVDTSGGDAYGAIYKSGKFNSAAVVFGGADTAATHMVAARDLSIYFASIHPEAS
jgi:hypothetical protein